MDFLILFLGLGAFLFACTLDISSSISMSRYGIKESVPLVRDKDGNFSLPKALFFVIGPVAVVLLVFFLVPQDTAGYDRTYAPLVLLPGAGLHLYAWWSNKKLIAAKQASGISGGVL